MEVEGEVLGGAEGARDPRAVWVAVGSVVFTKTVDIAATGGIGRIVASGAEVGHIGADGAVKASMVGVVGYPAPLNTGATMTTAEHLGGAVFVGDVVPFVGAE